MTVADAHRYIATDRAWRIAREEIRAAYAARGDVSSCVSAAEAERVAVEMRDSDEGTGVRGFIEARIADMVKQAYGLS